MSHSVTSDQIPHYNVKQRLRSLGASPYTLSRPEVSKLALLMQDSEQIEALVYGAYISGWGMLVATDKKLLFVSKFFFSLKVEELPYAMIDYVEHSLGRTYGKITVHAQPKDYSFRRVKCDCIEKFVSYVEGQMSQTEEETIKGLAEAQSLDPRFNYSSNFHIPTT